MAETRVSHKQAPAHRAAAKPQTPIQIQKPAQEGPGAQTLDLAASDPGHLSPDQVLELQHSIGNQEVGKLLQRTQPVKPDAEDTLDHANTAQPGDIHRSARTPVRSAQIQRIQRKANLLTKAEDLEKSAPPPSAYRDILRQMRLYEGLKDDDYRAQLKSLGKIRKMAENWTKRPPQMSPQKRLKIGFAMLELRDKADKETAEVTKQMDKAGGTLAVPGGAVVEVGKEIKTGGDVLGEVAGGTGLYKLNPTGHPAASGQAFTNKWKGHFDPMVTLDGKDYYPLKIGADTFYVLKTDVKVSPAKHEEAQGWLFPHPPTVNDVTQGGLGDCYLLAALESIVAKNPDDITSMMRDEGKTVTVRFYDVVPGTPKTYTPKFISIKKSVVKREGSQLFATGALWVPMLEKAYAAAGYQGGKTDPTGASAQARTYKDIASGFASVAFEHLVGKPFKIEVIKTESGQSALASNAQAGKEGFTRLPWSDEEVNAYQDARAGFVNTIKRIFGQKAKLYASLASFQILKDADQVDTWINFVKANKPIEDQAKQIALGPNPPAGYIASVRLGDFNKLFTTKGLDNAIGAKIISWMTKYRLYPGHVGSGIYTGSQMAFFERVRQDLKKGGYVALGSNKLVGTSSAGPGKSAGEQKYKGLVGGHAYAVLKVVPDKEQKDLKPTERLFLTLRNPWGEYGRKYKDVAGELKPEEQASAVFDLELSEVTERFNNISDKG